MDNRKVDGRILKSWMKSMRLNGQDVDNGGCNFLNIKK